jgi:hypothetical protein
MPFPCPVCHYPKLKEDPRPAGGGGSFEICPSCGYQFGVDDDDRGITFSKWRRDWLKRGAPWSSAGKKAPKDWDGKAQLEAAAAKPAPKKKAPRPPKI